MAVIPRNMGSGGSNLNNDKGTDQGIHSILLSLLEDVKALRTAAIAIDAAAGTSVPIAELVTKSEFDQ